MKIDFLAFIGALALFTGFCILLYRWGGGGNGGQTTVIPSTRAPVGGGWIPGTTASGYRNGGVGASSPEVWFN